MTRSTLVILFGLLIGSTGYVQVRAPDQGSVRSGTTAIRPPTGPVRSNDDIREIEVNFLSGGITLAGTLLLPSGSDRHPALVLSHGSGPGPRKPLRPMADRFARDGLAVLLFDKRGSGDSGGSWINASLDDLSDDAVAAAKFLRSRPEVDPSRVGVWGVSQAGWVIPHALARTPDAFQFAVVITGGGVKPIDVERYDYGKNLDRANVNPDQRRQGLDLVEKYFEYLRTGNGLAALEAAIAAQRPEPWFRAVDISRVLPPESMRGKWAWVPSYEPEADIKQIKIPILVVFGGNDRPGLTETAQARWRSALQAAGNNDATLILFGAAGHGIAIGDTHQAMMTGGQPTYAPGYVELVDTWLKSHCGLK